MAKTTLYNSIKFKHLVRLLPGHIKPTLVGCLELMWSSAWDSGKYGFDNSAEAEIAAEWPGDVGEWVAALISAGFLDQRDDGFLEIHDWWDHAPDYVKKRKKSLEVAKDRGYQAPDSWFTARNLDPPVCQRYTAGIPPVCQRYANGTLDPTQPVLIVDIEGGVGGERHNPRTAPGRGDEAVLGKCYDNPRKVLGPEQEVGDDVASTPSFTHRADVGAGDLVVMQFPVTSGKMWDLTADKVRQWKQTHLLVNVDAQLKKARQWLLDNPGRQKTARGMTRFLGSWMARAQKDLEDRGVQPPKPSKEPCVRCDSYPCICCPDCGKIKSLYVDDVLQCKCHESVGKEDL